MARIPNKKFLPEPSVNGLRIKLNEIANFYEGTEDLSYYSVKAVKEAGVLIILNKIPVNEQTDFVIRGYVDHYAKQLHFKVKKQEGNKITTIRVPVRQVVYTRSNDIFNE